MSVVITGGHYLFVEHVLSETNPFFATAQRLATPEHVQAADGCLGAVDSLYITAVLLRSYFLFTVSVM